MGEDSWEAGDLPSTGSFFKQPQLPGLVQVKISSQGLKYLELLPQAHQQEAESEAEGPGLELVLIADAGITISSPIYCGTTALIHHSWSWGQGRFLTETKGV